MQNTASDFKGENLQEIAKSWTERLIKAEITEAEWSVNKIIAFALGKKNVQDIDMTSVPPETNLRKIQEMCGERLKGKPIPYVLGELDFLDITLQMRQPVLFPRPCTEEFVKVVLKEWPFDREHKVKVLDIGCGTGALSVYILHQLPNVKCVAMDISQPSCKLTLENAKRYNLQDRIEVIHGDIFNDEVVSEISRSGPYDVVICNPPIFTPDETAGLDPETKFEDYVAHCGGEDGFDVIRKVIVESVKFFKDEESFLMLKVGFWMTDKVKKILEERSDLGLLYTDIGSAIEAVFCQMYLKK